MQRRSFLRTATMLGAATTTGAVNSQNLSKKITAEKFPMHFAPHAGMFKHHAGENILDQIRFAADQGFTAWEDNGMMNRPLEEQEAIGKLMAKRGMTMGVFVANKIYWKEPSLTLGAGEYRDEFLESIRNSVEVAKRCNAKWMTVVPGTVNRGVEMGYQSAYVVESLKQAADILEPHGLVMVLEPLNYRDHPNLFLTKAAQGYLICKAVNSPSCKVLYDIYHQQIQEGNLLPNIDLAWDEIAYFQIGDNPGRKEPTTGEINYSNVFKHIQQKGFAGVMGMEHGNSLDGKDGELRVIAAYRETSKQLTKQ